ncbi:G-protein coupled receptor moody-like [Lytechinus pictus]|uniref:G-protein coupled receptor moody-like n=1 Tax=Lytechinus pictus TaxID=7653 RepID=UPI00240DFA51|nr:G-protein coupled receptor moody-like [Lytechinus pictus]
MNVTDNSLTEPEHSMRIGEIVETALLGLICVVGTLGNLLVVVAVFTSPALQVRQNVFIFLLAITDLVTAAILTPCFMLCLVNGGWPYGENACIFIGYVTILSVAMSGLTVNCIAVCRYVTVAYTNPVRRKVMHGRVVLSASTSLLVMAIVAVLLPIFGIGDVGYNKVLGHCSLRYSDPHEWYYCAALITFGFIATFVIVPTCYGLIFCKVRKSRRSIESMSLASRTTPTSSVEHSTKQSNKSNNKSANNYNPQRSMSRYEVKLSKKLFALFSLFVLCWIPYTATVLADKHSTVPLQVHRATNFFIWINPCINPFLYAWMIRTYRKSYERLFSYILCREQSFCQ